MMTSGNSTDKRRGNFNSKVTRQVVTITVIFTLNNTAKESGKESDIMVPTTTDN